ncbi:MAG: carbamoyltransferase HypF [Deltaproteobacteria bacterium]|nr:carbamoyltransferase HypF [Deltaproteobacteria bacterium]
MVKRVKGSIQGIVQGVGFRPFIYQLAHRFDLTGYVINTSQGVTLEVEGPEPRIAGFFEAILVENPPLAQIAVLNQHEIPVLGEDSFEIRESRSGLARSALISPDVSICPDCLAELRDPQDRRYRYPFINCTNCGPRYTIIQDIPYDRPSTTMRKFEMCPACRDEYEDPSNRRFHAQPNACWECGPHAALHDKNGNPLSCADPVQEAVRLLQDGAVLAVKGLGGFHLAVDATNHKAVVRLRKRKHREEKPLAIMVPDLQTARDIARVSPEEAAILTSRQRPIVILRKRRSHGLSPQVAPRNRYFGIMLPYTPLHYLLMDAPFKALVMTSGNMTDEPINIENNAAFLHLKGIADSFLVHDRDIYLRSDDSIVRVINHTPRQIRRSRGYVPAPIFLPEPLPMLPPVLAVGGELKNTVCLTKENRIFLSQHVGDMENLETYEFFGLTISHLQRILEIEPAVIAHDLHPDYLSSRFAREHKDITRIAVQHHHAHIVGCMAEHGIAGPVIGLAMDGTGLGTDGHIWGGDIILADLVSFERKAHLDYTPLPGGDAAAKFPWRMALVYLHKAYGDALFDLDIPFIKNLDTTQANIVVRMARQGVNSPLTSSCGRLFDAVSSLIRLRDKNAYEGQAPIELEMCQRRDENGHYPWRMEKGENHHHLLTADLIRGIVEDLEKGTSRGIISARFHNTMIQMLRETCCLLREDTGIEEVAMSGGSFQNATLLSGLTRLLEQDGFRVYSHRLVPSNDGGLALGQAVCAGLRSRRWKGSFNSYETHG